MARLNRMTRGSQAAGLNRSGMAGQVGRGSIKVKLTQTLTRNIPRLQKRVDRGANRGLARAGAYIRGIAKQSLPKDYGRGGEGGDRKTSRPGQAPVTHRNRNLWRSIMFDVQRDERSVTVGALRSIVGDSADVLEHGGSKMVLNKNPDKGNNRRVQQVSKPRGKSSFKRAGNSDAQGRQKKHIQNYYMNKRGGNDNDKPAKAVRMRAHYKARPFMKPALAIAQPKIPSFFAKVL